MGISREMKFERVAAIVSCLFLIMATWVALQNADLKEENRHLRDQLDNQQVCPEVRVTCDCPAYEEGFEDCEFVQGCDNFEMPYEDFQMMCSGFNDFDGTQACDPADIPPEELRVICAEFDMYGYVPGC